MADVYRAGVYHEYFLEYIFYFSIYYTSEQQKSGVFTLLCDKACQLRLQVSKFRKQSSAGCLKCVQFQ